MSLDIARTDSAAAARARPRLALLGMSGRLLLLTIVFVMVAEVLIFVPSAADFRRDWMEERLQAARLASLAVRAAPDISENDRLAAELLAGAGVAAVAVKREGVRELVLNAMPPGAAAERTADLRGQSRLRSMLDTPGAFFPAPDSYMRIVGDARMEGAEFIEALVRQEKLARELREYSGRVFVASLLISLIVASLIYVTLNIVLVRPIRRLIAAMTAFAAAPENAAPPAGETRRQDELGQAQAALARMQRDLGQTLRHRRRLAALGEAVSRISHDLRAALASASLISDRLAADQDPRVRDLGARILRSINRAVRMCEATLRFGAAADAEPHPREIALRAALDEAADEAAMAALWRNSADPALIVRCDPEHLHRIALNLFRNADAAMHGRETARLSVTAVRAGGMVRIAVADTGPGLPKRALERLFQPFSGGGNGNGNNGGNGNGGHEGVGLGLAIARDLARANGGDLRLAHSGPDGAVFELDLPAA